MQSIIIGSTGQYVPGTFFAHLFKDYDHAIRQFQIVQTDRGAITLKVVKGKRYSDETLAEVLRMLHQFLGDDMKIDVDFVENVDMVRTGKRLATVSKLGIDFQNTKHRHDQGELSQRAAARALNGAPPASTATSRSPRANRRLSSGLATRVMIG